MVHNGIEYGEMQLLAEVYYLLRKGLQTDPSAIAEVFKQWNKGALNSYLLEISIDILEKKEEGSLLLDTIADRASSKGTGSWASQSAAELGVPAGVMTTALFARYISADGEERIKMNGLLKPSINNYISVTTEDIKNAYSLARLINHHQGFQFIQKASDEYRWNINSSQLAAVWTNGCIIRSVLMQELTVVLKETGSILSHPAFVSGVTQQRNSLAMVVGEALTNGMAVPVLGEAINYLHSISTVDSPMNLVQAQRDYFGAHTYQLKDDVSGKAVHTEWKKKK
jgi:6-phosphogluconate dehydrogenase